MTGEHASRDARPILAVLKKDGTAKAGAALSLVNVGTGNAYCARIFAAALRALRDLRDAATWTFSSCLSRLTCRHSCRLCNRERPRLASILLLSASTFSAVPGILTRIQGWMFVVAFSFLSGRSSFRFAATLRALFSASVFPKLAIMRPGLDQYRRLRPQPALPLPRHLCMRR